MTAEQILALLTVIANQQIGIQQYAQQVSSLVAEVEKLQARITELEAV